MVADYQDVMFEKSERNPKSRLKVHSSFDTEGNTEVISLKNNIRENSAPNSTSQDTAKGGAF